MAPRVGDDLPVCLAGTLEILFETVSPFFKFPRLLILYLSIEVPQHKDGGELRR